MISVIMSGLNVAQKDLQVAANNVANANTVGFKRSSAAFQDVFSNDPTANPKTAIGSGAITSMINRNTSQGAMTSTDKVTDLAIAGRGYFTLASTDPETGATNVVYTRAGNFSVNVQGEIVDSSDNQLQVFPVNEGRVDTTKTIGAVISAEKDPADVRVPLGLNAIVGGKIVVRGGTNDVEVTLKQSDIDNGYVTTQVRGVSSDNSDVLSATYGDTAVKIDFSTALTPPVAGDTITYKLADGTTRTYTLAPADITRGYANVPAPAADKVYFERLDTNAKVAAAITMKSGADHSILAISPTVSAAVSTAVASSEYRGVYLQGITVDSKGMVQATYGDGSKLDVGAIALASFRNDSTLKPIGNTKFVASDQSGTAILTRAGAPFAGDILSGTLEQANVDITQELMTMLKAQQLYNGNARMLQTAVEVGNRITDKL